MGSPEFPFWKRPMARFDPEKFYTYTEYHEAMAYAEYAEEGLKIKEIRELTERLAAKRDAYRRDMEGITQTARDTEAQKYRAWERRYRAKLLCLYLTAALGAAFGIACVCAVFFLPSWPVLLLALLLAVMLSLSIGMQAAESACAKAYLEHTKPLEEALLQCSARFAEEARHIYTSIDRLCRLSLPRSGGKY